MITNSCQHRVLQYASHTNLFGQLVTEYQEHGGAVNTGTSLKVQYAYADGSSNTIRPTKMTYPDGRELNYDYGSAGSAGDALSRVASLIDDDGSTHLVNYSYLGRNTFVKTDYPESDLRYDLAMGAGDDPYDGFDRFGRIVDSRWYDYGSTADADRILYGYDRASNRTYREQTCDSNSYHDEVYGHDGINRLTDFDRGTINGNKDAISTLKFAQQWSLDPTGNWSAFKEDDDGDSTWDLEQARTSNEVNEITNITETSGPAWVTPAYNRAGNMTTIPKPADPTASFDATYDAWNRLVKLEEGEDTVAEYVYDGAKRRVVKKTYDSGELDETRHFYYTDPQKWQVIEERLESSGVISANSDRQFVWGLRYIDDLALRDRDTDSNGSLDERLYALQDANWNVTALADTSGDVQERYAYSAYGMARVLTPTFTTRAASSFDTEALYAGYRYEQATALYHARHRGYHPAMGCWMQRDPIARDINLCRFVRNAPLVQVDPSGLAGLNSGTAKAIISCMVAKWPVANHIGVLTSPNSPSNILNPSACTSNVIETLKEKGFVDAVGSMGVDLLFLGVGSQVKGLLGNLTVAAVEAALEALVNEDSLSHETIIDVLMSTLDLPFEQAKVLAPAFAELLNNAASGMGSCRFVAMRGGRRDTSSGGESVTCQFLVCANTKRSALVWTKVRDWKVTGGCKYTCVPKKGVNNCCCGTSATISLKQVSGSGTGASCKVMDEESTSEGFPNS